MPSGIIKTLTSILNNEFSFKKLYYFLMSEFVALPKKPATYKLSHITPDVHIHDLHNENVPVINLLKKQPVVVRDEDLTSAAKIVDEALRIAPPDISEIDPLKRQVRWRRENFHFFSTARRYNLTLEDKLEIKSELDLTFKAATHFIPPSEIKLARRLRVIKEITSIIHYTKKIATSYLNKKIPVLKKPVAKILFSNDQIMHFKQVLADKNDTRRSNIEILAIFDKFNTGLYSQINQNRAGEGLLCHLSDNAPDVNSGDMYYLVMGKRFDNQAAVSGLAKLP